MLLKFANDKYSDAPILKTIDNFNITDLSFIDPKDRALLIEKLIYNAKLKSLDKLLGEHIILVYKKEDPKTRSIHTTDTARLNYIVKELIKDANDGESVWEVDKNGIKICKQIIKPLIEKCTDLLLEHQKELLDIMATGDYRNKDDILSVINVLMSIDKGSLENDINKYIAPHFNISKND